MASVELEKQLQQKKMAIENMNDEVTELRIHFEQTTDDHDDEMSILKSTNEMLKDENKMYTPM